MEVVAGDDCSTDDTVAILEEYRQRHGLRYQVNERNLGFMRNFEKIFSLCRGDFIALADQDDIWLQEKIEVQLNGLGNASLVYSDAFLVDEAGRELSGSLIQSSGVRPVSDNNFEYFVCNTCVTGCTTLFRRELLARALPIPACERYHDWWLAVAASRLNGVKYLDSRLVKYRQHESNDTGASFKRGLLSRLASHLRGETGQAKRHYYELLRNRANMYPAMAERLSLRASELEFLVDIGRYAEGLLDNRFHWETFFLAFRHRRTLFPAAGTVEQLVFVFSKLVNKFIV
jgi:glycosyltransferase involved in cell wall biosynthesis